MRISGYSTMLDAVIEAQRQMADPAIRAAQMSPNAPSSHIHPSAELNVDTDVQKVRAYLNGTPPEYGSNVVELVNKMIF